MQDLKHWNSFLTGLVSLTVAMCFRENFAYIFLGGNDSVHVEITWNDLKSWYLSLKYQFCDFEKQAWFSENNFWFGTTGKRLEWEKKLYIVKDAERSKN